MLSICFILICYSWGQVNGADSNTAVLPVVDQIDWRTVLQGLPLLTIRQFKAPESDILLLDYLRCGKPYYTMTTITHTLHMHKA